MKVVVRHGHFAFYPQRRGDVHRFARLFKADLVLDGAFYTFPALHGLPRWSQIGRMFGNLPAIVTYEGRQPWDVMRENSFLYSLAADLLVPQALVVDAFALPQALDFAIAPVPLVQPGALLTSNTPPFPIVSYEGELDLEYQRLYLRDWEVLSV